MPLATGARIDLRARFVGRLLTRTRARGGRVWPRPPRVSEQLRGRVCHALEDRRIGRRAAVSRSGTATIGSAAPRGRDRRASGDGRSRAWPHRPTASVGCCSTPPPTFDQQIAQTPELQPAQDAPLRSTPIRAVVLTNADVDHIAGLLSLRERQPFAIYATAAGSGDAARQSHFQRARSGDRAPAPLTAGRRDIRDQRRRRTRNRRDHRKLFGAAARSRSISRTPAARRPISAPTRATRSRCALRHRRQRPALFYIPGCARIDEALRARLAGAACLLFDGTVFTDDEMIAAGVGTKTGARMGHSRCPATTARSPAGRCRHRPAHLRPHQQHQPGTRREFGRTRSCPGGRMGSRP